MPQGRSSALIPAGCLAAAMLCAALAVNTNGLTGAIMATLTSIAAGLSLLFPLTAGIAVTLLLTIPLLDVRLSPGLAVLASPVMISVFAAQRRLLPAVVLGTWQLVVITLLTVWNSPAPTPGSVVARVLFWYLIMMFGYFLGAWIRRLHDRITEEETRRIVDLAEQRRALARELHDTAVRATTEVVLFSETAGKRCGIDPVDAREFARISRTARLATDDLRDLMESLRQRDTLSPSLDDLPVRVATWSDALGAARDRLESAGFTVGLNEESDGPVPAHLTPMLSRALAEIIANVIRHGERTAPVAVMSEVTTDDVDLLVVNAIAASPVQGLSGGVGLAGIRERLSTVGGQLDAHADGPRFLTHLSLPLRKDPT